MNNESINNEQREGTVKSEKRFDIQERTFEFAVQVVKLVNRLPRTVAGVEIGRQVVRSATSVGSNVEEADAASNSRFDCEERASSDANGACKT